MFVFVFSLSYKTSDRLVSHKQEVVSSVVYYFHVYNVYVCMNIYPLLCLCFISDQITHAWLANDCFVFSPSYSSLFFIYFFFSVSPPVTIFFSLSHPFSFMSCYRLEPVKLLSHSPLHSYNYQFVSSLGNKGFVWINWFSMVYCCMK